MAGALPRTVPLHAALAHVQRPRWDFSPSAANRGTANRRSANHTARATEAHLSNLGSQLCHPLRLCLTPLSDVAGRLPQQRLEELVNLREIAPLPLAAAHLVPAPSPALTACPYAFRFLSADVCGV